MLVVTQALHQEQLPGLSDLTPPVITPTGTTNTLACNPTAAEINAALGTATATDGCGDGN
jgi:hypothetical protein